jgi:hypothetical protein
MKELLSGSLTGAGGGPYTPYATERELTTICEDIRIAWMRKNSMKDTP